MRMPLEPLPEGVYGFVIASLIRDGADIQELQYFIGAASTADLSFVHLSL